MREKLGILAILVAFLGLVTFPLWHSLGGRSSMQPPKLVLPVGQKDCVMPVEYMRSSHMLLLMNWRDLVVRHDQHTFHAFDGKSYNMSLTGTCLGCHNKAQFCDRCHTYMGVQTPYCWNCHIGQVASVRGVTP
ncbi:MAG: sulfate reduction electron transfer complex DsrMKJOP subunit DsrJ [Acidobacteriaceae bacterium]|jgi:hypothetical protein